MSLLKRLQSLVNFIGLDHVLLIDLKPLCVWQFHRINMIIPIIRELSPGQCFSKIIISKSHCLRIRQLLKTVSSVHEIELDSSPLSYDRINSHSQKQVNNLKGRPKYVTLNREMIQPPSYESNLMEVWIPPDLSI